ncbi:SDR family oxidoreductase [Acidiferrimicrobium sp. IK]|uniref:SDR family NAD(P)-dependent oxidoreductase n=1 Tax=Acidiferrimicrobium sp. IK TaxID=2871700 RepID=UPI0021CB0859|nr:SDR family oxidoreductase [Acidiferrimicrobium sp. IK]MCU4186347.1 SDR family oxidoreductase [Acidiferrimicrobium sp. IK]
MAKALVTGSSRGIGKATALALAAAGFDVAVSGRTVNPGESRENTLTVHKSDARPLPGSLTETAEAVRSFGQDALMLPMDLTDRADVERAGRELLEAWGGVDVLVHNGRYIGPGLMDTFFDIPVDAYSLFFEAHFIAPVVLTRMLLPGMLERGAGTIITTSSGAGITDEAPPAPAGQGGWSLAYAMAKASGHRLVHTLHVEFVSRGILCFNVDPGYVATERNKITVADYGREITGAAPPEAIGAVMAWLATDPERAALAGGTIDAQSFALERSLHPAWA